MKTFHIDEASKFVLVVYSGVVTDSDLRFGLDDYGRLGPEYAFLVDFRGAIDFELSTRALRGLSEHWAAHRQRRCGVIAPTDIAFGICRMVEMYCDNPAVAVFRQEAQARE